ncbi:putative tRNA N6-adenosine threonylcarbamoyltransferase, mitochondrial [Glycine max]|nr:putative tRNA N6-adenosine threonylcarbamoyltransferase, mitochondrial [Glycine max]
MKSKTIKPGKHQRGNNRGERETTSNKTKSSKQQRGKRRREKCKQQHGADKKTQERKKGLPAKGETEAASSNGVGWAAFGRACPLVGPHPITRLLHPTVSDDGGDNRHRVAPESYPLVCLADLLAKHGGVAPKMAEEAHSKVIDQVVQDALDKAYLTEKDLTAVAVTIGPGLSLCLRVEVQKAPENCWQI